MVPAPQPRRPWEIAMIDAGARFIELREKEGPVGLERA